MIKTNFFCCYEKEKKKHKISKKSTPPLQVLTADFEPKNSNLYYHISPHNDDFSFHFCFDNVKSTLTSRTTADNSKLKIKKFSEATSKPLRRSSIQTTKTYEKKSTLKSTPEKSSSRPRCYTARKSSLVNEVKISPELRSVLEKVKEKEEEIEFYQRQVVDMISKIKAVSAEMMRCKQRIEKEEKESNYLRHMVNFLSIN